MFIAKRQCDVVGYSRTRLQHTLPEFIFETDKGRNFGAGAYQRHFSLDDIPQLRQLVDLCKTQEPPNRCDAVIRAGGDLRTAA